MTSLSALAVDMQALREFYPTNELSLAPAFFSAFFPVN
jgi:hypothetical protein